MEISFVLLGSYGILFFLSRKIQLQKHHRKWKIPFYKAAAFLNGKRRQTQKGTCRQQQLQSLRTIYRLGWEEYEERKTVIFLTSLFFALCFTALLSVLFQEEGDIVSFLHRPAYGEGQKTEELDVSVAGEKTYQIPVHVQARHYSEKEAQEKVEKALAEVESAVRGENETLDEVRSDLVMPKRAQEGAVSVEWTVSPYGFVSESGKILGKAGQDGEVVKLEAALQCQDKNAVYTVFAKIFPKVMTEEEQMVQKIETAVKEQDGQDLESQQMYLPDEIEGQSLLWRKPNISAALMTCMMGIVLSIFLWNRQDQKIEKLAERRQEQLKMDYAVLIFKFRMLLGAGMTIRAAFFRIASEYEESQKRNMRWIYEEMVYACREMKSGVAEETVYEQFGQRCGQPRYVKFGRILAQHLKKGTEGLEEILEQEMRQAQEERMMTARQKGEEAATKLLLPMGMMLMIVLVILILPAFLNF